MIGIKYQTLTDDPYQLLMLIYVPLCLHSLHAEPLRLLQRRRRLENHQRIYLLPCMNPWLNSLNWLKNPLKLLNSLHEMKSTVIPIHDSDSEIMDDETELTSPIRIRNEGGVRVVEHVTPGQPVACGLPVTLAPPATIEEQIQAFLTTDAGQVMKEMLAKRHEQEVRNVQAASTSASSTRARTPPPAVLPQTAQPPLPMPPTVQPPMAQLPPEPQLPRPQPPVGPRGQPMGQPTRPREAEATHGSYVAPADEAKAKVILGQLATLHLPQTGHTSRAGVVRYGNNSETSWMCRCCEHKVLAVRKRGELVGVPIYVNLAECDSTADPPITGAPSAKELRKAGRTATPPYPWLFPLEGQQNPAPIVPGRPVTNAQTPTDPEHVSLSSQAGALGFLRTLLAEGRHAGVLETEPLRRSRAAGQTAMPQQPPTAAPQSRADIQRNLEARLQAAGVSLEELRAAMRQ